MYRTMIWVGVHAIAILLPVGNVLLGGEKCAASAVSADVCCDRWDSQSECDRLWEVNADALFLYRHAPADVQLMFNQDAPAQNLNAADFDFGMAAGFDVSAVHYFDACNGAEVRYFGLDPWSSDVSVPTTVGDPLQVNTVRPLITEAGNSIDASYQTGLDNFEINGRRQVNAWLTLLAGFRYLELDERFQAELPGAVTPFDYEAVTRNRLYGAQLGGQALLWGECDSLTIEAVGKAGIYGNRAAQDSMFATNIASLPARGTKNATSFVGELGLSADYCITDRLSVRGGYRLLWITGVALATDQVAVSDFISVSGINATGDAFYHGAFVGLEYGW